MSFFPNSISLCDTILMLKARSGARDSTVIRVTRESAVMKVTKEKMKVAVIGGGIGGSELVRLADKELLDLTLIEPKENVECQALYPEYLGGLAKVEEIAAPLKPFCERVGAKLVKERALAIEDNVVVCEKSRVPFDVAVVAVGASQNYFGIKGTENTFSINTMHETDRAKVFIESKNPDRVMIIGSGLTGVESACVLAESLDASIYIIEAMDRVLPNFDADTSEKIEKALGKRGVNILLSTKVEEVEKSRINFADGSSLDCEMAIWTAGIKPSEFINSLDLPKNRGWIKVDDNFMATENIMSFGDCAWIETKGQLATKTAIEAENQAKHAARNLERMAKSLPMEGYTIKASTGGPVALISLGCDCAVGVYGKMCITMPSRLIYSLKSWIDRSFIKRFK
jgi:NADH:ubiquinone reductase (H+-translocating)